MRCKECRGTQKVPILDPVVFDTVGYKECPLCTGSEASLDGATTYSVRERLADLLYRTPLSTGSDQ